MDPEIFTHPGRDGLLPLLTLAKGGKNRETVQEMVTTIQERNRPDLLELAYDFAALVFDSKGDKSWLKEEFPMLHTLPILEHSWRVQELKEQGREEARQEAALVEQLIREEAARAVEEANQLQQQAREEAVAAREEAIRAQQQTVIGLVAARFPQLAQLAQILVTLVSDPTRLQTLIIALSIVPNEEQATTLLTSLVKTEQDFAPLITPVVQEPVSAPVSRERGLRRLFDKVRFWRHHS